MISGNEGVLKVVGLMKVAADKYNEEIEVLSQICRMQTTRKATEQWTGIVGLGLAEVKARGEDMVYKDVFVETPTEVAIETIALGLRLYMEDLDDELYGALEEVAGEIGAGHKKFREIQRANIFNGAFGTWYRTGLDGLALLSTAHTFGGDSARFLPADTNLTALPTRDTTTWSNRLATDADFDYISYSDMITLLRRQPDRQGDPMNLMPEWILFPPELQTAVNEVLGSSDRPDTANRSVSGVVDYAPRKICSQYLVDSDAWFLGNGKPDIIFFDRMPMRMKKRDATGNWDILWETMSRSGIGAHDPRRWCGTPGA